MTIDARGDHLLVVFGEGGVGKTDQVGAAIVAGSAQAGQLQLANGDEPVIARAIGAAVGEVGDAGLCLAKARGGVTPTDRHPIANEAVVMLVLLCERARDVGARQRGDRFFDGR
jgi:hypothetical protein